MINHYQQSGYSFIYLFLFDVGIHVNLSLNGLDMAPLAPTTLGELLARMEDMKKEIKNLKVEVQRMQIFHSSHFTARACF